MSQAQIVPKRKKKFTGGNASKRHRDRVNVEFNNLAKLLPFPENVIAKLDKSSILRLSLSYIKAKSFFNDILALKLSNPFRSKSKLTKEEANLTGEICEGNGLVAEIFLQALDGFLIVVTADMKVLYVSDSVRDYLGYCQAGIIHESLLQFVHATDHHVIRDSLTLGSRAGTAYESDSDKGSSVCIETDSDDINIKHEESDNSSCDSGKEKDEFAGDKAVERRFVCRMKCALSCSSRFYTAFRSFQFTGHVKKSKIKLGKEKKILNTLIAFCTPTGSSNYDAIDFVSEGMDDMKSHELEDVEELAEGLPKMSGLHIEPRLRPHVAPIPVTQNDGDRRSSGQGYSFIQSNSKDSYRRPSGQFKESDYINGPAWPRHNGHPPYNDLFRTAIRDYSTENRQRSPTWNSKSPASSGRSTPESENGKMLKRPRKDTNVSPDIIPAKYPKLFDPTYVLAVPKPVVIDDINRGAHLLLELSNSRKQYGRHLPYGAPGMPLDSQTRSSEFALLANRLNGCIPSLIPTSYHDPRIRDFSVIRSTRPESEKIEPSPPSPKKDERKSFHISNILGLKDDKSSSKETNCVHGADAQIHSPATSASRSPASRGHSPLPISRKEIPDSLRQYFNGHSSVFSQKSDLNHTAVWRNGDCVSAAASVSTTSSIRNDGQNRVLPNSVKSQADGVTDVARKTTVKRETSDIENIDDIKHSFARILSGLTTSITSNLDKTINTVFQSSGEIQPKEDQDGKERKSLSPDCTIKGIIDRKDDHRVIIKGLS